jgi:DNA-directed RNA polymerase specialized sigma24 family protein
MNEWERLRSLAARSVAGDRAAWRDLFVGIHPIVVRWLSRPSFLGPIAARDDHRHDIALAVCCKLEEDGFRRLRGFFAGPATRAEDGRRFAAWLRRVVKNAGIDHLRSLAEYARDRAGGATARLEGVRHVPLRPDAAASRPAFTLDATVRSMLAHLDGRAEYRRALELWSSGADTADIARALGLDGPEAAERMLRAAKELLRRRFAA